MASLISILIFGVVGVLGLVLAIYALVQGIRGLIWLCEHVCRHVFGAIGSGLRCVAAGIVSVVLAVMTVLSVAVGAWSNARRLGRRLQSQLEIMLMTAYDAVLGHPLRLVMLGPVADELEHGFGPSLQATRREMHTRRAGRAGGPRGAGGSRGTASTKFPGYRIVGTLKGGGSGAKLYVAEPDAKTFDKLASRGEIVEGDRVVIKCFDSAHGVTVEQVVRESRSLEPARALGLVLDHDLRGGRFFYVMRYVPGPSLTELTHRMHSDAGAAGLRDDHLQSAVAMAGELLGTLGRYHSAGLWHKDVKPDNIIVEDGRAQLVDLGLMTPLRSAMTLTTHGTEYFRDPELVRMAMRGAKVRDVEGQKFDLYGVGACLYAVVENSFPAHGGLSSISKRCPEALRWVIRRAMTDLDQRYASVDEMLADLRVIGAADNAFALKPADLPSMGGARAAGDVFDGAREHVRAHTPVPSRSGHRLSAVEQRANARRRVETARARACARMGRPRQCMTPPFAVRLIAPVIFAAAAAWSAASLFYIPAFALGVIALGLAGAAFAHPPQRLTAVKSDGHRGMGGVTVAVVVLLGVVALLTLRPDARSSVEIDEFASTEHPLLTAVRTSRATGTAAVGAADASPALNGRLLVVDASPARSAPDRAMLDAGVTELRAHGYDVIGPRDAGSADAVAGALAVVGTRSVPGEGEAALRTWLDSNPLGVEMVVWDTGEPEPVVILAGNKPLALEAR
ncbi:MAG: hypothetical protein AAGI30_03760 [Planctomycetota bacterium]